MIRIRTFGAAAAVLLFSGGVSRAQPAKAPETPPAEKKTEPEKPAPPPVLTTHEISVAGKPLRYTATTGYMPMKDEDGKLKANIFFVAYVKDGGDPPRRPITFAFNGGPGSSSVWLHLGALGPRRVPMTDEGWAPPPPYRLTEIITVFKNASPILSDAICGSSATVRCTRRRA